MLEKLLIDCCSPTLASLKSGSMFNCRHDNNCHAVEEAVENWNVGFEEYGIRMCILRMTDHSALIYVYRESSIARSLKDPEISAYLKGYGYDVCSCCDTCGIESREQCNIERCIDHLRKRLADCGDGFPHEIGIFLDYPLDDVQGFIKYKGKNCKMIGSWKVYGNVDQARKCFERFSKCTSVYSNLWSSGKRSILQLTVAG